MKEVPKKDQQEVGGGGIYEPWCTPEPPMFPPLPGCPTDPPEPGVGGDTPLVDF